MDLENEQNGETLFETFIIIILVIFVLYLWLSRNREKPKNKNYNSNNNHYHNFNKNNNDYNYNNENINFDEGSNNIINDNNNYNSNSNYHLYNNYSNNNNDKYYYHKNNNNNYNYKNHKNNSNYNDHINNINYNSNNNVGSNYNTNNNYNNIYKRNNSNNNGASNYNTNNNYNNIYKRNNSNNNSINNYNRNNNSNNNKEGIFNSKTNNLEVPLNNFTINQTNDNYLGEKYIHTHFSNKKVKRNENKNSIENHIESFTNVYKAKPPINTNNFNFSNNFNGDIYSKEKERQQNIDNIGFLMAEIGEEPKIGLNNIGATCYMNATIQCLSHTVKLTNYFLNPKHKNFINSNEKQFSKEFYEVLKRLWIKQYNNNNSNYSPTKLKEVISQMEPLFQGIAANDSKDLVNFILQQLHSELNLINKNNENNIDYNVINQTDEQGMLNYFLNDFQKNNRSIVSDIFFGITETKTECLNCKRINLMNGNSNQKFVYNFQIINFIIFPLEEIRKYKNMFNYFNNNEVNLYDCFDFYQKTETMQGENQMWCNHCGQNSTSNYSTRIYSSPEYLILILNRGKGNMYNVKLNFDEVIDIGNYVYIKNGPHLIYHLYAVVTHYGPSSMAGHFIAFCKSPFDNKWYQFNDSMVTFAGDSFKQVKDVGCHYILFYERQE